MAAYNVEDPVETKQSLIDEISSRSCIQKEEIADALADAIETEASEAHSFDTVTSLMRLQQLADF